jgi:hypothetical protein
MGVVAVAGLLTAWAPPAGPLGVAWVIVVIILSVAVCFAVVVVTVAPMEGGVVRFFEGGRWQRWRDVIPAVGSIVGRCRQTGPAVGGFGFVLDIHRKSYGR